MSATVTPSGSTTLNAPLLAVIGLPPDADADDETVTAYCPSYFCHGVHGSTGLVKSWVAVFTGKSACGKLRGRHGLVGVSKVIGAQAIRRE